MPLAGNSSPQASSSLTAPGGPTRSPGLRHHGTVAHRVADCLVRHGVRDIFGQSLPSLVHLACAERNIRQVAYRTENAGGYMADGYARAGRRVAVVTAQNGPAATLLVPPLAEALKASVAIVALVQDVNRNAADRNAFQEFDHLSLFRPCTKWVRQVTDAGRIEDYVDQAFIAATTGRPGPVALLLPADLLTEQARPETGRRAAYGAFPLDRSVAAPTLVGQAATLLAEAEHPLVIAGGGVHLSDACAEMAAVQELAALPVATTTMGKGAVDEDHPLSIGVAGYFMGSHGATRFHRPLVDRADIILLVGTRTNQNGTDSWSLYPRTARFIHIDVDGTEVGRSYEAVRLVGDAKLTLAALADALRCRDLSRRNAARPALEGLIREARGQHDAVAEPVLTSDARPIRPERVMAELAKVSTPETIVVADASYASIWTANYLPSRRAGMRFLSPRGLAGLGWGFPMALGAKLAKPESPVVAVVGDGGFAHVWAELETARRMGIAVTLIVLNNQILGYQKHAENVKFGAHTSACDLEPVDHAAIARACGCDGERLETPGALADALHRALAAAGTVVLDVVCDPDAYPPITAFEPAAPEA